MAAVLVDVGVAEVGLLDPRVAADHRRVTDGDDLAEVEDPDRVADAHHQVHVVLDHQDAHALGGEVLEQVAEVVGLGLVEARGRLVEQQQPGGAGQAAGQLEQPGGAGGDRVGPVVGVRRDADALEQPVDVGRRTA